MELVEIAELYRHIKKYYPAFDASIERVKEDQKYLWDFPRATAQANVDEHIRTSKYPPNIAEIRGNLGEQMDAQRSKEAAAAHFTNLDVWSVNGTPPPEGYWESMKRRLRGEADA